MVESCSGRTSRWPGTSNRSEKVVEVWRMIAEGTIEERMDALQQEKRNYSKKSSKGMKPS